MPRSIQLVLAALGLVLVMAASAGAHRAPVHIELRRDYIGLPKGTSVHFTYLPADGNCLDGWNWGWSEDVTNRPDTMFLMETRHSKGTECEVETGRASWRIVANTSDNRAGSAQIVVTDSLVDDTVTITCVDERSSSLRCQGGTEEFDGDTARPTVKLGPVVQTRAPRCTITGTDGPDVLRGTSHADVICGRGGNDVIRAGAGDDVVRGGAGDDVIHGGPGDDVLHGGPGDDVLHGGLGHDRATSGRGAAA